MRKGRNEWARVWVMEMDTEKIAIKAEKIGSGYERHGLWCEWRCLRLSQFMSAYGYEKIVAILM